MIPDEVGRGMVPQEGTSEVDQWRGNEVGPHGDHNPIYRLRKECVMNAERLDIFLTIVLSCKRKVNLQALQGAIRHHAKKLKILHQMNVIKRVSQKRIMKKMSTKYKPLWLEEGNGRKGRMHGQPGEGKRKQSRYNHPPRYDRQQKELRHQDK